MMYLVVYPGLVFEPWLQEHEDYRAQQAELEKRALQIRVSAREDRKFCNFENDRLLKLASKMSVVTFFLVDTLTLDD